MGEHTRQKLGTRGSLGLESLKHSEDPEDNCLGAKLARSACFLRAGHMGLLSK